MPARHNVIEPERSVLSLGPSPARRRWHLLRGAVVGVACVLVIVLARGAGVLGGYGALVVLALLALAVPTSRQLSRRVLLAGCLLIGWLPITWWVPWPEGLPGRGTTLLAALAGGLGAWIAGADDWRPRIRSIVPRARLVDTVPFIGGAGTALMLGPWLSVERATSALAMLATGWDHSAHFGMTEMTRQHGVFVTALDAAPMNEHWAYVHYPQGYHSLAATVMDLLSPTRVDASTDIILYSHAMALIMIAGVVVLLAGVCGLPSLRRRPLAGIVLSVAIWSVICLGPGGRVLFNGFPNFLLACLMLGALLLLLVPWGRVATPWHVAAAGGAVVAVAQGWLLLVVLVAPAVLVLLLPLRRTRWRGRPAAWTVTVAVVIGTALASAQAYLVLGGQHLNTILVIGGGITEPDLRVAGAMAGLSLVVFVVLAIGRQRRVEGLRTDDTIRTIALALVLIVGTVTAVAIAQLQIRTTGGYGYYFLKFVVAMQIQAVVLLSIGVAALLPLFRRAETQMGRMARSSVAALACFGLLTMWGGLHPALGWLHQESAAPGMAARTDLSEASARPPDGTSGVLGATSLPRSAQWPHLVYLSFPSDARLHPISASQWLYALTGTWTDEGNASAGHITERQQSPAEAVAAARTVLARDPLSRVAVGPGYYEVVRDSVAADGWSDRVLGWVPIAAP